VRARRLRAGARSSDHRDDATSAPSAVLVGSVLLVPTALLFGSLAVLILRSAVSGSAYGGLDFLFRGSTGVPATGAWRAARLPCLAARASRA